MRERESTQESGTKAGDRYHPIVLAAAPWRNLCDPRVFDFCSEVVSAVAGSEAIEQPHWPVRWFQATKKSQASGT